jgi:hypothetical protein
MRDAVAVASGANGLILGGVALAAALRAFHADLYHRSVQEDGALEWTSFWLFALAALTYARCAVAERRASRGWPWFFAGLALFCGFVALEEISWGQRLLGYRPPAYFLEQNYQQEFNLHNLVEDDLRKLSFHVVVVGYGALLPWLVLAPGLRGRVERIGVRAPSPWLVPSFAVTGWLYAAYPWPYTGEWAEAMLGAGLLFTGGIHAQGLSGSGASLANRRAPRLAPLALAAGLAAKTNASNASQIRD